MTHCYNVQHQAKSVFKHMQNAHVQIILRMRKVSSGPFLSFHTFCCIQWFCYRTVKALFRLRGCAGWSGPSLSAYARRHVFAWRGPQCHTSKREGQLIVLQTLMTDKGKRHWFMVSTCSVLLNFHVQKQVFSPYSHSDFSDSILHADQGFVFFFLYLSPVQFYDAFSQSDQNKH